MVYVWFKVIILILFSYATYPRENKNNLFFFFFSEDILTCNPRGMNIGSFFKRNSLQDFAPDPGKSSVSQFCIIAME